MTLDILTVFSSFLLLLRLLRPLLLGFTCSKVSPVLLQSIKKVCSLITNETVTVLGNIGKPNEKAKPDQETLNLVSSALLCLAAMDKLPPQKDKQASPPSLDTEKTMSNIAAKLIEFQLVCFDFFFFSFWFLTDALPVSS